MKGTEMAEGGYVEVSYRRPMLQDVPWFREKMLQLYNMILVRHGVMVVGEPLSGKTQAYQVCFPRANLSLRATSALLAPDNLPRDSFSGAIGARVFRIY